MKRIICSCLILFVMTALSACENNENPELPAKVSDTSQQTISKAITSSESQNCGFQENTFSENTNITSEQSKTEASKTLIAYFSLIDAVPDGADAVTHATPSVGNTESAAIEIQNQVGGDLFAIKTVRSYPSNHKECSAVAEEEMRTDARPELSTHVENMEEYSTIYIGYPIWWYMEPMAIRTFLEEYDFAGKTVIPFCTTLGASIDESEENITSLAKDANVLDGVTLRSGRQDMRNDISEWLADIGIVN